MLTFRFLIFRGLDKTLELYVDMDLDAQQESHFEQHELKLTDTCNETQRREDHVYGIRTTKVHLPNHFLYSLI